MKKVILISIDGMRPDGFMQCGHPYVQTLMKKSTYTLNGQTVMPSVTLPCHMSMFLSVPPERHGVTTNLYMPPVRPVSGLVEQIRAQDMKATMYYGWEPLRDVVRPDALWASEYVRAYAMENSDKYLTERALSDIQTLAPDFVFLYMVETDEKGGHDNGWMSTEYLARVHAAIENVKTVIETVGEEYTVIITADHGGHDRRHGTEEKEDMTIPVFFVGPDFTPGKELDSISILDIAPTIATLMGVTKPREWEGTSIL